MPQRPATHLHESDRINSLSHSCLHRITRYDFPTCQVLERGRSRGRKLLIRYRVTDITNAYALEIWSV